MGRKQSRRVPLKRRHRIEKKVSQHNKKLRNMSGKIQKKSKKDLGVPNSVPFKEEVLNDMARQKLRAKEEEQAKKEKLRQERMNGRPEKASSIYSKTQDLGAIALDAARRGEEHEEREEDRLREEEEFIPSDPVGVASGVSRKYYYKEFKKVVVGADVIMEVLDARDPLACRCPDVEKEIVQSGKRLVLILNKIDLVPKENVKEWINYLRKEYPTIPFKASTQQQRSTLGRHKLKLSKATDMMLTNSKAFGADNLLKLIGNYTRNNDIKTAITIGVIGLPNVGKSSLINSLVRSRSCNVGAMPGITKTKAEIKLSDKVKLLDSPGVIMQKKVDTVSMVLRNCVPKENIKDPVEVIKYMLTKVDPDKLAEKFRLPRFQNVDLFVHQLARRRGLLKKGGIPDRNKACKILIDDWNLGNIHYFTKVPSLEANPNATSDMDQDGNMGSGGAELRSEFSDEFDIDSLMSSIEDTKLEKMSTEEFVETKTEGAFEAVTETVLESESNWELLETMKKKEQLIANREAKKKGRALDRLSKVRFGPTTMKRFDKDGMPLPLRTDLSDDDENMEDDDGDDNYEDVTEEMDPCMDPMFAKKMKSKTKQLKRLKKRTTKVDNLLAEAASFSMSMGGETSSSKIGDDYDFSEHFAVSKK